MKTLFALLVLLLISFAVSAQIYDANLNVYKDVNTIAQLKEKLGIETNIVHYRINDVHVVELYEEGTGKFVGFIGDTTKIRVQDIRYFQQDERMSYLLSKYLEPIAIAIYNNKVFIGMTTEEATDSWGEPKDINRTITEDIVHEQWVYGMGKYLYFENGELKTIQD